MIANGSKSIQLHWLFAPVNILNKTNFKTEHSLNNFLNTKLNVYATMISLYIHLKWIELINK